MRERWAEHRHYNNCGRIVETLICRSLSLHQFRKPIIVLSHECNIFLELNRLCALERSTKLLQWALRQFTSGENKIESATSEIGGSSNSGSWVGRALIACAESVA
jgi:hypothetical protein